MKTRVTQLWSPCGAILGTVQLKIPTLLALLVAGKALAASVPPRPTVEGAVLAWGDTAVPASWSNVVSIAAGWAYSLALKADGTVLASGFISQPPSGLSNVVAIAAGGDHCLALKSDGTVIAWGDNEYGQSTVPAGLSAVAIAAGDWHSLALNADGTVVAWGQNDFLQASVSPGLRDVVAIAAGGYGNMALKADGTVVSWGFGSTNPGGFSWAGGIMAIAAGLAHQLALSSNGTVVAWSFVDLHGEAEVPGGLNNVVAIAAGGSHSLALKVDGTIVAWGDNRRGQGAVPANLRGVMAIAAGRGHSLALRRPPPINDHIASATAISTLPYAAVQNTTSATRSIDDPLSCAFQEQTVWYAFTPERHTLIQANTVGSTYDTVVSVFTDEFGALTEVACQDGTAGPEPKVTFSAEAQTTYYLMIGARYGSLGGVLSFAVQELSPPSTSECGALHRFFPLHEGDQKELTGPPGETSLSVSQTLFQGQPVFKLCFTEGILGESYYYTYSGTELLLHGVAIPELEITLTLDNPLVELDERLLLLGGARTSRTSGTVEGIRFNMSLSVTVTDAGTVTVPAATYHNCRRVTLAITVSVPGKGSETTKQAYVLAPGVGQIRISEADNLSSWIELTSGTVGGEDVTSLAAQSNVSSPRVTTQPLSRAAPYGSIVTFQVTADGSGPLGYQWMRNGANLTDGGIVAGANSRALILAGVRMDDEGVYSVTITNPIGCITSDAVTLRVVPDVTWPSVAVTGPAPNARVSNAVTTIRGTAADNAQVDQVRYQLNGGTWETATGTTNWTAIVALLPGTNLFRVYALDPAGNTSLTNSRSFVFVVTSPLHLSVNGEGSVSPLTDGQVLELGKRYTVKATPRPGNLFSNWTGGVISASPTLTFTMSSNLALAANFVPNPFLGLKGSYTALFYDTNAPAHENAGLLQLALTDQGAFSGKLQQGAAKYPFSGRFDLALSAQKVVPRRGTDEVVVSLQLTSGTVRVAGRVSNAAWASELFGYRTVFNSASNKATNFQGNYTILLPGAEHPADGPMGHGFARLTVSSAGSVSSKGTLGDGSAAVQSMPLASNGQWPIYAKLYAGKGSIFGWLTLLDTPTNDVAGPLLWTKPGGVPGPLHPAGFTNQVEVSGSRYIAPPPAAGVFDFTNAVVLLNGGNLAVPLTNHVTLDAQNKVTVTPPNMDKLALTLTAPTGTLKGSFVHPQTGKLIQIKGVLLPGQSFGAGFFLGTDQSGRVFLGPSDLADDSQPGP